MIDTPETTSSSSPEPAEIVDRYLRAIEPSTSDPTIDLAALEESFVRVAKQFADQHGISYPAWRDVGVTVGVLRRAGIRPRR